MVENELVAESGYASHGCRFWHGAVGRQRALLAPVDLLCRIRMGLLLEAPQDPWLTALAARDLTSQCQE